MKLRQAGNTKVWILIAVLAVVAGVIVFVGKNWPPGEEGVSGTIVPAERYRANQIDTEDVVLGEETSSAATSADLTSSLASDNASDKADNLRADQLRADNLRADNLRADNLKADQANQLKADQANQLKADQANH